jgi:hypothetical protein
MCDATLGGFEGGLVCTDVSGGEHTHRFESTTVRDRHDDSEAKDD